MGKYVESFTDIGKFSIPLLERPTHKIMPLVGVHITCGQFKDFLTIFKWVDLLFLEVTSHTKPNACDLYILRTLIGRKGQHHPNSCHTRRWRTKGPMKVPWTKVYMVSSMAHYGEYFMVYQNLCHAHLQEVGLTQEVCGGICRGMVTF